MTREEALETLLDNAENGMVDVEEIKAVFAEMDCLCGKVDGFMVTAKHPHIKSIHGTTGEITIGGFWEVSA